MYRVRLLKHHGITPFIVFDGGPLPAKKGTEVSRAKYVQLLHLEHHVLWAQKLIRQISSGESSSRNIAREPRKAEGGEGLLY